METMPLTWTAWIEESRRAGEQRERDRVAYWRNAARERSPIVIEDDGYAGLGDLFG